MARFYKCGFVGTTTPSEIAVLKGSTAQTSGRYTTFDNGRAGGNFQVTAGQTLYIGRIIVTAGAATSGFISLGYGDTAVADSAAAPTNPIAIHVQLLLVAASAAQAFDVMLIVPASKYPYYQGNGANCNIQAFGIMHA